MSSQKSSHISLLLYRACYFCYIPSVSSKSNIRGSRQLLAVEPRISPTGCSPCNQRCPFPRHSRVYRHRAEKVVWLYLDNVQNQQRRRWISVIISGKRPENIRPHRGSIPWCYSSKILASPLNTPQRAGTCHSDREVLPPDFCNTPPRAAAAVQLLAAYNTSMCDHLIHSMRLLAVCKNLSATITVIFLWFIQHNNYILLYTACCFVLYHPISSCVIALFTIIAREGQRGTKMANMTPVERRLSVSCLCLMTDCENHES